MFIMRVINKLKISISLLDSHNYIVMETYTQHQALHSQSPPQTDQYTLLKQQIENIQRTIHSVKNNSFASRNARIQKMADFNHQQHKKQLQFEQALQQDKDLNATAFKVESLGGLVVQMPQNNETHLPQRDPYSPGNSIYYITEIINNYRDPKSAAREHLQSSLQILKALEKTKMPRNAQITHKILNLQVKPEYKGLRTIAFDLDETLIHCNESLNLPYDIKICIRFPTGQSTEAGINIRPGAIELLQLLKGKYEVMIFTASHSCYANEILDYLDPKGELIQHRLYREHCSISNEGYYIKDLRILGREMKNVLLVDNAAYSYAFQLDNGVPILPYFKGKNDYELKVLGEYLLSLVSEPELRRPNQRLFKLNRYLQFVGKVPSLVEQLYVYE